MNLTTITDVEHGTSSYSSGVKNEAVPPSAVPSSVRTCFFDKGSKRETKDLTWFNVSMKVKSKQGQVVKDILKDVWGVAKGGELTAIMGASGAGKTSLFNILAGRAVSSSRVEIQGDMYIGDAKIDPNHDRKVRTMFAFVAQEDALHEPSTPRQALRFSAKLRLPRSTSDEEIDLLVNRYIEELGLEACCDTIIGGGLRKGISGGEKRRVSIGVELIAQPSIIFLDEPTSGLDSFAAKQVMKLLQKVAEAGNIVLFTIHQPSSDIFASFDRLILLNRGGLMYHGLIKDINADLAQYGFPVPQNYNPADWILDVAQENDVESLAAKGFFEEDVRKKKFDSKLMKVPQKDHATLWTQLVLLVGREKTGVIKNPMANLMNISITSFLGIVFGVIFFQVGGADRAIPGVVQGQVGALINVNISTMMGQAQAALTVFASERPLFLREYSTDHYSILPYFVSHLATEALQSFVVMLVQALLVYFMIGFQQSFWEFLFITFSLAMTSTAVAVMVGSFFSDVKAAQSLFTLVVVPQMYFSGVFIAIELIPQWIRWSQWLCSLTYASRLSFAYEFQDCEPGVAEENCSNILQQNGVSQDSIWWYWLALAGLFVGFRLCALFVLRHKGATFS